MKLYSCKEDGDVGDILETVDLGVVELNCTRNEEKTEYIFYWVENDTDDTINLDFSTVLQPHVGDTIEITFALASLTPEGKIDKDDKENWTYNSTLTISNIPSGEKRGICVRNKIHCIYDLALTVMCNYKINEEVV